MSVKDRDPLTGHSTTHHEWNGITELNTRVPRVIWWFIGVTHLYALIAWILLPAFPLGTTYTKGLLGLDMHEQVEERVAAANAARSVWADPIANLPFAEIRSDPRLMRAVKETGPALFGDNCAACHGPQGRGGPGFPNLTDDAWLWGGDPDTILETLRVGINTDHPDTRVAQMLAFGRDGILSRDQVRLATDYVRSLSGAEIDPAMAEEGRTLFADNCASCHGEDGTGLVELGAPDLTDDFWIYGGDPETLFESIHDGRQGWMPSWEGRLEPTELKILTLHVLGLEGSAE
jgi:cytochrome c oxidase cbb3-type subunit III